MIGLPGGMRGDLFDLVKAANTHGMPLVEGKGGDQQDEYVVYIYDTAAFPFFQAEEYHQFHPNRVLGRFVPASYTGTLKSVLHDLGRLVSPCDGGRRLLRRAVL